MQCFAEMFTWYLASETDFHSVINTHQLMSSRPQGIRWTSQNHTALEKFLGKGRFEQPLVCKDVYIFIMTKKSPNQTTNSTSSFDMVIQNTTVVRLVLVMSKSLTAVVYRSVASEGLILEVTEK